MPSVRFQPANVVAEVPAGTLIHQAAIRAGILDLELPCGGEGVCGLCKVQLEGRDTAVLACRTKVTSDIVVHLPERQRGARVLGDSQSLVDPALLPERASSVAVVPPAPHHNSTSLPRGALQRLDPPQPGVESRQRNSFGLLRAVRLARAGGRAPRGSRPGHGRHSRVRSQMVRSGCHFRQRAAAGAGPGRGYRHHHGRGAIGRPRRRLAAGHPNLLQPADPPRGRCHHPHRLRPHCGTAGGIAQLSPGYRESAYRANGGATAPWRRATFAPLTLPAIPP